MKKLIIVGGRGNAATIASLVEDINAVKSSWDLLGFFNDELPIGTIINDYPVIGRPEEMVSKKYKDVFFSFNPLLSMQYGKNNADRLESMELPIERFATIIHPMTFISRHSKIGHGVVIMPLAHVRQNTTIGNHCTLLYASSLGHDSTMEDYAYLGNNAVTGSEVVMEVGAFLGTKTATRERVRIGRWSIVGTGSVIIKDVDPMMVVAGNPARFIKKRSFDYFRVKKYKKTP